jgi:hypothetical protein
MHIALVASPAFREQPIWADQPAADRAQGNSFVSEAVHPYANRGFVSKLQAIRQVSVISDNPDPTPDGRNGARRWSLRFST